MTTNGDRPAALPHTLGRLRLRLTAWYVGTFFAILTLLGIGMFATITKRFDSDLNASLVVASHELTQLVSTRERHIGQLRDDVADAVDDLRIPDRTLFLTDTAGTAVSRGPIPPWVQQIARGAWARGALDTSHAMPNDRVLRVHAERFLAKGSPFVAIAVADEIEVEDRYASLIAAFGAAALASLVLVAVGGWFLARQSTDPVERAIVHMRRFMADAAHELRTPLTVVRSRAEIALQRTREPEDYVLALRGIERESARLGRIVEDLLMLARADTGERPIEHQRIFLDDVTLDAAEAARAIADRKAVRVEVDSFEEAPVVGDPDLLRQLVMILLDNAVKFTPVNGVVHVGVKATPFAATLTVSDSGIGITGDQLPHVFERFYRGDPSRTRAQSRDASGSEGAGLGLSIAQWICDEHGGTIRIDSQPGEGTVVVVELPAAGQAANPVMFQTGSRR
jgi:signal transduction histidine kinase